MYLARFLFTFKAYHLNNSFVSISKNYLSLYPVETQDTQPVANNVYKALGIW